MWKPLIVGINGSQNPSGRLAKKLDELLQIAELEGAQTIRLNVDDYIHSHYDSDPAATIPKEVDELFKILLLADGIIFTTPTWGFHLRDKVATLMNHLWRYEHPRYEFKGVVAGAFSVCEEDGGQYAADDITRILGPHLGMHVVPFGSVFCNWKVAGMSEEQWQLYSHLLLAKNIVMMAKIMRLNPRDWNDMDYIKAISAKLGFTPMAA